ncbi:uncharacterized protein G2W53_036200 [Senna tora]|uniref:Uncharacterized protein n=1 Tax=Senna tora TaxID=362788 RepID=A0A834STG6_9FABA|nr:uncharacterized protein G2W53_036200 [Senna tora]
MKRNQSKVPIPEKAAEITGNCAQVEIVGANFEEFDE